MKEVLALMESCLYFKVLMENFMEFGRLWILGYMVTLLARVVSGLWALLQMPPKLGGKWWRWGIFWNPISKIQLGREERLFRCGMICGIPMGYLRIYKSCERGTWIWSYSSKYAKAVAVTCKSEWSWPNGRSEDLVELFVVWYFPTLPWMIKSFAHL